MTIFGYPEDMDVEMIPLCEILNQFRGIDTLYSCCGHNGRERFYISLVCTADALEDLFKIFDREKFEIVLSDKYYDDGNRTKIMDIETKTNTKRVLVGIYTRIDESDRHPYLEIEKKDYHKLCINALRLLATKNPEGYYRFKSALIELYSSIEFYSCK